jgi:DNA topoisomerase-2
MSKKTEKYIKMSHKEHILEIPDTYVGSMENIDEDMYIYEDGLIIKKTIKYIPALYKLFDEILVNARDAAINDPTCNQIDIICDIDNNFISIFNNGDNSIPIEEHSEYKCMIPTMIFGELLTSSNYNKDIERTTGGKNGYGAKLVNIFSTKFIIEINNFIKKKYFIQEWLNNMTIVNEPIITKSKEKSSVKIIFYPDFERFKITNFTEDYLKLFHRRTIDIAGTTDSKIKITFNNTKIEINNFKNYLYFLIILKIIDGLLE